MRENFCDSHSQYYRPLCITDPRVAFCTDSCRDSNMAFCEIPLSRCGDWREEGVGTSVLIVNQILAALAPADVANHSLYSSSETSECV